MTISAAFSAARLAGDRPSGPSSPRPTIVNQGPSAIEPNLLILGGTADATQLCTWLANTNLRAILSLAGRVARPRRQPLPMRVGGFGGVEGLRHYLRDTGTTHVVDATHPFASQMSRNAIAACNAEAVPMVALARPAWRPVPGDNWKIVPDMAGAVAALDRPAARVMLAIGRMHLSEFAANPQHRYLLRLVDPPAAPLSLPRATVIKDRGPFSLKGDLALMREHRIELVVSKNAGGTAAIAKITAARELGLPVIMIDRPAIPARDEVDSVDGVLAWLRDHGTDLGV